MKEDTAFTVSYIACGGGYVNGESVARGGDEVDKGVARSGASMACPKAALTSPRKTTRPSTSCCGSIGRRRAQRQCWRHPVGRRYRTRLAAATMNAAAMNTPAW